MTEAVKRLSQFKNHAHLGTDLMSALDCSMFLHEMPETQNDAWQANRGSFQSTYGVSIMAKAAEYPAMNTLYTVGGQLIEAWTSTN